MPLLENLGFNVISERTFDIEVTAGSCEQASSCCTTWNSRPAAARRSISQRYGARSEEAFVSAFSGTIDNDSFNRLILSAGCRRARPIVLRAYARYLRQAGIAYSQDYIADHAR